jgi:hypothetical protein
MDRKSFLCCQSFLYPLPSSGLVSDKCNRYEVLLTNMELSIEPCENNYNNSTVVDSVVKSLGPAYFLKPRIKMVSSTTTTNTTNDNKKNDDRKDNKKSSFDPTMCKVELRLHTEKLPERGMTTPVKKANRRNPSEIDDQTKETASDEVIVIAVIDGNSFQVDLNRMRSITSSNQKGEINVSRGGIDSTKETTTKNSTTSETTPCLILEFPSCCFRIFPSSSPLSLSSSSSQSPSLSMNASDDATVTGNSNDSQRRDDVTAFDLVQKKLKSILTLDYVRPFPLSYSGLTASSDQNQNQKNNNNSNNDDDTLECARMCLQSYSKSWNNFISFGDVLKKPVRSEQQCSTTASSMMTDSIREKDFKETISQFMQTIPKQVSSSFIEVDQRETALNLYDEEIGQQNVAFDDIIREYWPKNSSSSSNKRRRVENQHNNNNVDYIGQFADILKEHKKLLKSKHELFLLPLQE